MSPGPGSLSGLHQAARPDSYSPQSIAYRTPLIDRCLFYYYGRTGPKPVIFFRQSNKKMPQAANRQCPGSRIRCDTGPSPTSMLNITLFETQGYVPDKVKCSGVVGGIEKCLQDRSGCDGVEVLFLLFSRYAEGGEFLFRIETAEPLILEEEG